MRSPSVAGFGSAAATTSRGATSTPFTGICSFESSPSLCSVFSTSMNSSPSPYLNVTRSTVDPARDEEHLLVLDVDALDRPDALGEVEHLGLGERRRREPAAVLLPDDRRVQALLDRRPDREGRREVVALDDEVRAVADADLVDLGEELVGGVAREDVGGARLDADADEREQPLLLPRLGPLELVVAELHAGLFEGVRRVRLGERHRHVEVGHAGLEAGVEDRHVEQRVDRVENGVGVRLPDRARRPSPCSRRRSAWAEKRPSSSPCDDLCRPRRVVVRERAVIEERAALRDLARRQSRHHPFRRRESARRTGSTRTTRVVARARDRDTLRCDFGERRSGRERVR